MSKAVSTRIACSMQTHWGRAWEIWWHVVSLGRLMGSAALQRISNPFFVLSTQELKIRVFTRQNHAISLILLLTTPGMGKINAKQLGSGIGPQFAYPWLHDVTTCDKLKSPRPSPSIFAHCNPSLTGGGNSLGTKLDKTQMLFYIYDVDVLVKLHTTSMRPANVHAACVCTWPWTAYCTQLHHNVHTLHHNNLHYKCIIIVELFQGLHGAVNMLKLPL